ncbi:MAG: calcium/sodium antiporter [Gemmatimonadota bacterium]
MENLPLWANVLVILASATLLALGAKVVVDSAVVIAQRLGMSELVLGLTVVAFGTSAPEFAVTLLAAFEGRDDISVGNIVGSNIFNLGLILGGAALIRAIPTTKELVWRDASVLVGSSLLLLILVGFDLSLDHWDGWIFFTLFVAYLWMVWLQRRSGTPPPPGWRARRRVPLRESVRLVLGLGSIGMASHLLVVSSSGLARAFGMTEWVIAVTIVAAGTSLPELATTVAGVIRGHATVGIGNVIGSDIFNLLGVLGVAGIIETMELQATATGSLMALSAMTVLTMVLMRSGWRLSRWEGALLISVGVFRWGLDLFSPGVG